MMMRRLTFVVTAGRSGSTALSKILDRHPDVLSLNEMYVSLAWPPFPPGVVTAEGFWRVLTDQDDLLSALLRSGAIDPEILYPRNPGRFDVHNGGIPGICLIVLPALAPPGDVLFDELAAEVRQWPPRLVADHYLALFDWLADRFGRRVVVERSGYSLPIIPMLRNAFPHARFVHLYRDGPDCALSMSRHNVFRLEALIQEISDCSGVPREECLQLSPDDPRVPDDLRPVLCRQFGRELITDRPIPLVRFGALWSEAIEQGIEYLAAIPESQWIAMRYEDLLDDPDGELARLAGIVGVEPLPQWLADAREMLDSGRRGSVARLDAGERAALVDSCAPGMRALGLWE